MINRIVKFYFTGTDTTKTVVDFLAHCLARELEIDDIHDYNFTTPGVRKASSRFQKTDLVIGATPTIAGRVPNLLLPYLEKIQGNGALGVSVVLFGNRNFDDSLMELYQIMKAGNINVIGAAAFIGEHSFSKTLGKGRPDLQDLKVVEEFAHKLAQKIKLEECHELEVKGEWPLRPYYTPRDRHNQGIDIRKVKPKTEKKLCINCKLCARLCPMGAIDFDDVSNIPGICMKCCACEKKCPTRAKYFDDEGYLYHARELEDLYSDRKEPEYFL